MASSTIPLNKRKRVNRTKSSSIPSAKRNKHGTAKKQPVALFDKSLIMIVPRNGILWAYKNHALSADYKDKRLVKSLGTRKQINSKAGMERAFQQMYSHALPVLEVYLDPGTQGFEEALQTIQDGVDGFGQVTTYLFIELFFGGLAGRVRWEDEVGETWPENHHRLCEAAKSIDIFVDKIGEAQIRSLQVDYDYFEKEIIKKLKIKAETEEAWVIEPNPKRPRFAFRNRAPSPKVIDVPRAAEVAFSMIWPSSTSDEDTKQEKPTEVR